MVVVGLIVAGLAVAGVFSNGKKRAGPRPRRPPPRRRPLAGRRSTKRTTTTTTTTTTPSGQGGQTPAALPTTTLKTGSQGSQVKLLQQALAQLGYAPGPVDGDFGPLTEAGVMRFQTASNLAADGIVGPLTLAALGKALPNSG